MQETSGICRLYPPATVKTILDPALFVFSNHFTSDNRAHIRVQDPCDEQAGELMFSVWQGVGKGDVELVTASLIPGNSQNSFVSIQSENEEQ